MKYFINLSLLKRNRNFCFLYLGQFVSFIGAMITVVALPYQIYHMTHSTLMIGLLSLFQLLPLLVTALIGGVFADRYHRRMLLLCAEILLAVGCLLLAMNSAYTPRILFIFIIAIIMSAITGLHRPALDSIVQQIVKKEDYPEVGALATLKFSVGMIAGPAIGGILIASVGLTATYIVDFATFAFSLLSLLLMTHIPKPLAGKDESTWSSLKSGFKYATSRQELMGTYFVDFVAMIFGMPMALFPAIAASYGGAKTLGLLYSAPAVGALFISVFSGWTKHVKRQGLAVAISAVFWGIAIVFFGLASNLWVALFFLALAGGFDSISGIFRSIMWNELIPNDFRGRLAGIEMISYLSGPKLGDTESGLIASAFGITFSIVSGGILCVVGVGFLCMFLPKFLSYRPNNDFLESSLTVEMER
ncbi:MAG: MFS transporter [Gammaproteobacteria bacterium]|nr:MFS transporter [Gammaproteobacteria bacterium]